MGTPPVGDILHTGSPSKCFASHKSGSPLNLVGRFGDVALYSSCSPRRSGFLGFAFNASSARASSSAGPNKCLRSAGHSSRALSRFQMMASLVCVITPDTFPRLRALIRVCSMVTPRLCGAFPTKYPYLDVGCSLHPARKDFDTLVKHPRLPQTRSSVRIGGDPNNSSCGVTFPSVPTRMLLRWAAHLQAYPHMAMGILDHASSFLAILYTDDMHRSTLPLPFELYACEYVMLPPRCATSLGTTPCV